MSAEFHLNLRLVIRTRPVVRSVSDEKFWLSVANYAVITMGSRLTQFEKVIGSDGVLVVDHTFKEIDEEYSYHNQMKWKGEPSDFMRSHGLLYNQSCDTKIQSHFVLWLFHRCTESGDGSLSPCQDDTAVPPHAKTRCFLLGAEAVNMRAVMQRTLELSKQPMNGSSDQSSFQCGHNFCETFCICTVEGLREKACSEKVEQELKRLVDGLEAFRKDRDDPQGLFMVSPLDDLCKCNEVVKLQQVNLPRLPFPFK